MHDRLAPVRRFFPNIHIESGLNHGSHTKSKIGNRHHSKVQRLLDYDRRMVKSLLYLQQGFDFLENIGSSSIGNLPTPHHALLRKGVQDPNYSVEPRVPCSDSLSKKKLSGFLQIKELNRGQSPPRGGESTRKDSPLPFRPPDP